MISPIRSISALRSVMTGSSSHFAMMQQFIKHFHRHCHGFQFKSGRLRHIDRRKHFQHTAYMQIRFKLFFLQRIFCTLKMIFIQIFNKILHTVSGKMDHDDHGSPNTPHFMHLIGVDQHKFPRYYRMSDPVDRNGPVPFKI